MFIYKLANSTIRTTKELGDEVLEDLSGRFKGGLLSLIAVHSLGRKQNWLVDADKYYYAPMFGLVRAEEWSKFLPQEFLNCEKTITQICVENGIPRSFARFLNEDESFKSFVNSPRYRHFLGTLNHSKHTNYGQLANSKKTGRVRISDRKEKSFKRVSRILETYNAELLEDWRGTRDSEGDIIYYKVKCRNCGCEYETYLHASDMRVCPSCKEGKFSAVRETTMRRFIESLDIKVLQSYRLLIKSPKGLPMELDLYLPDLGIAFEFNGYRYHTSSGESAKSRDYHEYKTKECLSKGVKLYHIWSDTSEDLCKSLILSKVGRSKRVYARKCVVGTSTTSFMKNNHVDGDCRAIKRWSLYYQGIEVCQLSLRVHREGIEIARFASLINHTVVGGYSKLLKCAIDWARGMGYRTMITYCNRDLSPTAEDSVYQKLGFSLEKECSLILKYVNYGPVELNGTYYKSNSVIPRQRCQKHLLLKHLGINDSSKTEAQLAEELGIYQVFNSGNFKFRMSLD